MGILMSRSFTAMTMPWAMTSHRMMPPKMFTRMASTCEWRGFRQVQVLQK